MTNYSWQEDFEDECDCHEPYCIHTENLLREKIQLLEKEVERLKEGIECHLARPGEGTYECNPNKPCPACRLRVAEERAKEEKNV